MPGVYSTVLSGHEIFTGQFWQVVWHWLLEETGVNSAYLFAKNLVNAVWAAIDDFWLKLCATNVAVDNISGRKLEGGPTFIKAVDLTGDAGSFMAGTMNEGARVAWVMVDETHLGATIVPGIPTGRFTDEAFTAAYVSDVTDFADAMTTTIVVGGGGGDANFMVLNHDNIADIQLVLEGVLRPRPAAIGRRTKR